MLGKAVRLGSGFALVGLGLAGLVLPIMPGWVFLIPGLIILSDFFPPIRRLVAWAKAKAKAAGEAARGKV
jgi:uncharacterized membrane protein YbaN (DUF454 family)